MPHFDPHKSGVVTAVLVGGWHAFWALLVALGLAQPLMDMVFRLHMIRPPYTVMPFNLGMAFGLVVVTAIIGYVLGHICAMVWNGMTKK